MLKLFFVYWMEIIYENFVKSNNVRKRENK